ncbi:hypothetical protein NHQ30_003033 [Ciborinia camelliae]|nr:hypothetical protein NHQ30_003033 [Ciborinia camelliae]
MSDLHLDTPRANPSYEQFTIEPKYFGRFVFLERTRYDVNDNLTVLGCTLYSRIIDEQRLPISRICSDFSETSMWCIDAHNAAHRRDLTWLNFNVEKIEREEPHRKIVVFTHFSPRLLEAANRPKDLEDPHQIQSAYMTEVT